MIKCKTIGSETNRGTTLIKEYTFNDLNDVSDSTMIYIDRRRVNMRLVCLNLESSKENNTDIRKILLEKIKWKNPKYNGIQNKLKTKEGIITTLTEIIDDKTVDKKDAKNILKITETRITNAFGINRNVNVSINKKTFGTSLENLLRDTHDIGKDIFTNKNIKLW